MIVVLSDTHATDGLAIGGALARDVRRADLVVHAGDFTATPVLDDLEAAADRLVAVHGNADGPAVRERLPTATVVEAEGLRIAVTHRLRGGETGLAYFGREREADVVVSGHTHRPAAERVGDVLLLNPGSHAKPRGTHPTYAVLEPNGGKIAGTIRTTAGRAVGTIAPEGLIDVGGTDGR